MPMTNGESIRFAISDCYARSVSALSQGGPHCTAYVALWLRKRSRDKPFFAGDYFHLTEEEKKVRRYEESNDGVVGKGATKAGMMQERMKGDRKAELSYITSGSRGRPRRSSGFETWTPSRCRRRRPGTAGACAN